MAQRDSNKQLSKSSLFGISATSGMFATCLVQPIDLVKTRMQLSGLQGSAREHKTFIHAFANIVKKERISGLYNGLSAGLFRQFTYTGTRLGIYSSIEEAFKGGEGKTLSTPKRLASAGLAGGIAAVVGTPAEVSLIRMTADGRLPPSERRGYKNVLHALFSIVKKEGVFSLWTGVSPTVVRAVVLNTAQLASYSEIKQNFLAKGYFQDGTACHIASSFCSGFIATAVSTPIDTIKTRMQNNKGEFKGLTDVIVRTIRTEGPFSLMKGFMPFFFRLGPHTVITFVVFEKLKKLVSV